jgi:BON domain-containing protein
MRSASELLASILWGAGIPNLSPAFSCISAQIPVFPKLCCEHAGRREQGIGAKEGPCTYEATCIPRAMLGLILTVCSAALAQMSSPSQRPVQQTPPTFPQSSQPPPDSTQQEPATPVGTPQSRSAQLETQINNDLHSDPTLAGATVTATVTGNQIVLSGTTMSEAQHQRALEIASSNAADRSVVDQITMRGTSSTPEASEANEPQQPPPPNPLDNGTQPEAAPPQVKY